LSPFFHICIIDAHAQFLEEDNYYLINRLNPATSVSLFYCLSIFVLLMHFTCTIYRRRGLLSH